jgi:hypothetical protein
MALNPAYACYAVIHHIPTGLQSAGALSAFLTQELGGTRHKVARWDTEETAIVHFHTPAAAAAACSALDGTTRLDEAFRRAHEEGHPLGSLPSGALSSGGGGGGGMDTTVANRLIRNSLGARRHNLGGDRSTPAATGSGYLKPNAPLPSRADGAWQRGKVGGGGGGSGGGGSGAAAAAAGTASEEPRAGVRGRGSPHVSEERSWWRGIGAQPAAAGVARAMEVEGPGGEGAGADSAEAGGEGGGGGGAGGGGGGGGPVLPKRRPLLLPTASAFVPGGSRLVASSAEFQPGAAGEDAEQPAPPPPPCAPPPPPPPPLPLPPPAAAPKPRGRGSSGATFGSAR